MPPTISPPVTELPDDPPILLAEGMHKRYGGVHALRGATLSVRTAEVHALMGENGSGKSTLLRILSGQLAADAGSIHFAGRPTSFRTPTDALRQGIATVTQETTLAPDLSIAENIFLGHRMAKRAGLVDWRTTRMRARAAIERLGLDLDPSLPVRRLRPDLRQMVEIARALSIDARVLILDEPTSSLMDDEVASLFAAVRKLRDDGVSTIFVSHRIDEVFELADRVSVLRDGHSVGESTTSALDGPRLIHMMVGRELEEETQIEHARAATTSHRDLCFAYAGSRSRASSRTSISTWAPARSSVSPGWSERAEASCSRRSSDYGRRAPERSRSTATTARSTRPGTPSAAGSASSPRTARPKALSSR